MFIILMEQKIFPPKCISRVQVLTAGNRMNPNLDNVTENTKCAISLTPQADKVHKDAYSPIILFIILI